VHVGPTIAAAVTQDALAGQIEYKSVDVVERVTNAHRLILMALRCSNFRDLYLSFSSEQDYSNTYASVMALAFPGASRSSDVESADALL
jgi:hypothetical protein